MDRHIFKPGDMAMVIVCVISPKVVGMHCIIESEEHLVRAGMRDIVVVDITIGHPVIKKANIECLKYVPPEDWPQVFKMRELVPVEKDHAPTNIPDERKEERREPTTTE